MNYFLWLLAFSLTLPAYAQKAKPRKAKITTTATKAPATVTEPVLVFQRTPCHGTCPTYTATIYADGRVEYNGQRYVNILDKHTLSLPVATVNQMLTEAKRVHFDKFQERYSGNTTDLPATIITVRQQGAAAKSVYAEQDIPDDLEAFIAFLNAKLDPLTGKNAEK